MTVIVKLNEELETLSKSIAILHEKDKDLTEKITQMKLALNKDVSQKIKKLNFLTMIL